MLDWMRAGRGAFNQARARSTVAWVLALALVLNSTLIAATGSRAQAALPRAQAEQRSPAPISDRKSVV